jgi:hypothetical protein
MEQHIAMKHIALAAALALLPSAAWAQCTGVFPPNTLCGNPTGVAAPPSAFLYSGSLIGPGSSTANGLPLWSNTAGTILKDGNGQTVAGTYTWSGTQNINASLGVQATDPLGPANNINQRDLVDMTATYDINTLINPGFTQRNGLVITLNGTDGDQIYGNGSTVKSTFLPLSLTGTYTAEGQRFLYAYNITCLGKGDCSLGQSFINYAGYPSAGDEGTGYGLASRFVQSTSTGPGGVVTATVSSISRNTCNTTTTQTITGAATAQSFTVASNAGCTVGTWIVLQHEAATGFPNHEATQITAVSAGSITAKVAGTYANGVTVTPAVDMIHSAAWTGQGRVLVDTTATPYTTGTVTSVSGGQLIGTGTGWSNTMLTGGTALVPGCISLAADDYTGAPYGAGALALHDWYQIKAVVDATHLNIQSFSAAGDQSYKGKGPGSGAYTIRPCAEILRYLSNAESILDTNSFAWTVNNILDISLPPYPDTNGDWRAMAFYSSGGTLRSMQLYDNQGARAFASGIAISCIQGPICNPVTAGADAVAYQSGISISYAATALNVQGGNGPPTTAAIFLAGGIAYGQGTDVAGRIAWGNLTTGPYIQPDNVNGGMSFYGGQGLLNLGVTSGGGHSPILQWGLTPAIGGISFGGIIKPVVTTMGPNANVGPCNATSDGGIAAISDGETNFAGLPITTGFGSAHVLIRCNATRWTVLSADMTPVAFSALPGCGATQNGGQANVTDSSTATWGATVTGGGANNVLARCNGSAWTVVGK